MKVLIADQDKEIRYQIKEILRLNLKHGPFTTFLEEMDGKRTLATFIIEKPDLAFLDISLPELGGQEIIKILQETGNESIRKIPILLIVNPTDKKMIVEAIQHGLKDFIVKPIDIEVLMKKVEAVLKSSA